MLGVEQRVGSLCVAHELAQEDPASSGKIMDYSQGLVNNMGDSNDLDMRFYFIPVTKCLCVVSAKCCSDASSALPN